MPKPSAIKTIPIIRRKPSASITTLGLALMKRASGPEATSITVTAAITVMLVASGPVAGFIEKNPTIVMLALGFLLMIGTTLIADGLGFHVPKGYIYSAMAFSALVEGLNMLARRRASRRKLVPGAVRPADH